MVISCTMHGMKLPTLFLRVEGAVLLVCCALAYLWLGFPVLWFVVLFFSFDISILGYLFGTRAGAISYNSVHSFVGPAILGLIGIVTTNPACTGYALIWFAHLGFDRMIGFGFMKPTQFGDSNLGRKTLPKAIRRYLS